MEAERPLAVDARQLAAMLGLSVRTIRRLDSAGRLPRPIRIGGAVRWKHEEICAWVRADCPDRQHWESMKTTAMTARVQKRAGAIGTQEVAYPVAAREAAPRTNGETAP